MRVTIISVKLIVSRNTGLRKRYEATISPATTVLHERLLKRPILKWPSSDSGSMVTSVTSIMEGTAKSLVADLLSLESPGLMSESMMR